MNNIQKIETDLAPKAIGSYSQAVIASGFVFVSGQIAMTSGVVSGDIKKQTKQVIENIKNILIEAGTELESVVKVDVFLKNMSDFAEMNTEYEKFFFGKCLPARVTVGVSELPKNALVEISCIALKK